MTRSDLIKALYQKKRTLQLTDIEKIVDIICGKVSDSITEGRRIELRGFGIFSPKRLAPKVASNPKGGSEIRLGERTSVKFKAGKALSQKINSEQ